MFLLDGVFLLRPELLDAWDFRVFVTVVSQEIIRRAPSSTLSCTDPLDVAERRYRARYLPAQRHYRRTFRPGKLGDIVLENDDRPRCTRAELKAAVASAAWASVRGMSPDGYPQAGQT